MESSVQTRTILGLTACALMVAVAAHGVSEPSLELRVIQPDRPLHPHRPLQVGYEISWIGDATDYVIFPAELESIDWGTVRLAQARCFVRDGRNFVVQTVEVVPYEPGDYEFPTVQIAYVSPEQQIPPETPPPSTGPPTASSLPTLRAEPFPLEVQSPRTFVWVSGGLGAFVLCTALGCWWIWRRPIPSLTTVSGTAPVDYDAVRSALQTAKQRRMDDEFYECYQELSRLAGLLSSPDGELVCALKNRGQEVGYRGVRPSEDLLDMDFREVERLIKRRKEETEA